MALTARERITRSRIQLQRKNPFFAYLVLNLNPIEMTKEQADAMKQHLGFASIGVDIRGNLVYNPAFIDELDDSNIESVLCHEILHLVFSHLQRTKTRNAEIFNIANDLVVNDILVSNNFNFSQLKSALLPYNHEFIFNVTKNGYKVKDIDKKSSEAVYDEIYHLFKDKIKELESNKYGFRFDEHIHGKELTEQEYEKIKKEWKHKVIEAYTYAKNIGQLPIGIDKRIDALLDEKINWKALLYRYVTNTLPFDYCLDKNTRIKTNNGYILLKDIKIGDKIIGIKNDREVETIVKNKFNSLITKKYTIYAGDKKVVCSANHKFLTNWGWIEAKDLNKNKHLLISI